MGYKGRDDYTYIRRFSKETLPPPTIFQAQKLEKFSDTFKTLSPTLLQEKEYHYLRQWRQATSTEISHTRVEVLTSRLHTYPTCPVCRKPLFESYEMHEALLTRGDVQSLPFSSRMQIFCPQNCVHVHVQDCHHLAQFYPRPKRFVAMYLIKWNGIDSILDFLHYMNELGATRAQEVEREINLWYQSFLVLSQSSSLA